MLSRPGWLQYTDGKTAKYLEAEQGLSRRNQGHFGCGGEARRRRGRDSAVSPVREKEARMGSKRRAWVMPFVVSAALSSSACKFEKTPPAYALITLKHDETRIQMVTILEVPSTDLCESAFREFMEGYATEGGGEGWRETERSCQQILEPLYQGVMNRETFHATYLAFSPKGGFDFEGRLVLYGIPSSQAHEICQEIAGEVGDRLGVNAECVQGTIG
jgi:hypothetical protein